MGENTGIQWTDSTWNPWIGCRKVSPACAHCYAEREMTRYGRDFGRVKRTNDATFYAPRKWKEGRKIFTCSWSDFFIEQSSPWRVDAWTVMLGTPQHTYQILTKRPEQIPEIEWPCLGLMKNVWLGVSVENRQFYKRIDAARRITPNLLFLSIEPLLGPMPDLPLDGIGWVIVGGESGTGFRPLNLDWVRQIRDRCVERDIPFFFKQKSAFFPKREDRLLDGRQWNEIPRVHSRGGVL